MRFQSYFNTAIKIIQLYDGKIPLQYFLKQYFSQHKKHGSNDRKFITHICYNFYRLGKCLMNESIEERLKIAIFICNHKTGEWNFLYDDEWLSNWNNSLQHRINFIQAKFVSFSLKNVFPFDETSFGLNAAAFTQSFFIQPDVFIRIRPGCSETVINKLKQHKIGFNYVDENCIALPAATNINSIIKIDEEAVIQDYASQQIKEFLEIIKSQIVHHTSNIIHHTSVWDCCAGSGGKSILAYDVLENIRLTVSDVRPSIIQNLKQRFAKAGIKNYNAYVADISNSSFITHYSPFDFIICDAPCTGSGTWSRTPEQLYLFQPEKINEYALLQKQIISNAITSLKNNGFFLYITCSVFKKENEANAEFIQNQFDLELIKMELIKGYDKKADSMFAALFKR